MELKYKSFGQGDPIIILHGLFSKQTTFYNLFSGGFIFYPRLEYADLMEADHMLKMVPSNVNIRFSLSFSPKNLNFLQKQIWTRQPGQIQTLYKL